MGSLESRGAWGAPPVDGWSSHYPLKSQFLSITFWNTILSPFSSHIQPIFLMMWWCPFVGGQRDGKWRARWKDGARGSQCILQFELQPIADKPWEKYRWTICIHFLSQFESNISYMDVFQLKILGKPNFLNTGQDVDIQCRNKRIRWESSEIVGVCPGTSHKIQHLLGAWKQGSCGIWRKGLGVQRSHQVAKDHWEQTSKNHVKSCYPILQRRDLT